MRGSTEGNCIKRMCTVWGLRTYILLRELISHAGMTQDSDWPELHTVKHCRKYYALVWCYITFIEFLMVHSCGERFWDMQHDFLDKHCAKWYGAPCKAYCKTLISEKRLGPLFTKQKHVKCTWYAVTGLHSRIQGKFDKLNLVQWHFCELHISKQMTDCERFWCEKHHSPRYWNEPS